MLQCERKFWVMETTKPEEFSAAVTDEVSEFKGEVIFPVSDVLCSLWFSNCTTSSFLLTAWFFS